MKIGDSEAYEWRKEHRSVIEAQLEPLLKKAYRRSQSKRTVRFILDSVTVFCSYLRKLPNEILEEIRTGKKDPYKLLDDFVGCMTEAGLAPFTIKNYLSAVKNGSGLMTSR